LKIFKRLIYQTNLKYPKNQSFKTRPGGRPGPRPGFRVLAGSPGLTGSILFKKNQNDVVLVKKNKSQRVCHRVLTGSPGRPAGSAGSHRVFPSPVFSSTRPVSGPRSARRAGPGFKTMPKCIFLWQISVKSMVLNISKT